jgi:hypothetical protein
MDNSDITNNNFLRAFKNKILTGRNENEKDLRRTE